MNTIISKLISLAANQKSANHGKGSKSAQSGGDLFSGILKSLNTASQKSTHKAKAAGKSGTIINKNRYHTNLESLRKALLAKGKPLNKAANTAPQKSAHKAKTPGGGRCAHKQKPLPYLS